MCANLLGSLQLGTGAVKPQTSRAVNRQGRPDSLWRGIGVTFSCVNSPGLPRYAVKDVKCLPRRPRRWLEAVGGAPASPALHGPSLTAFAALSYSGSTEEPQTPLIGSEGPGAPLIGSAVDRAVGEPAGTGCDRHRAEATGAQPLVVAARLLLVCPAAGQGRCRVQPARTGAQRGLNRRTRGAAPWQQRHGGSSCQLEIPGERLLFLP